MFSVEKFLSITNGEPSNEVKTAFKSSHGQDWEDVSVYSVSKRDISLAVAQQSFRLGFEAAKTEEFKPYRASSAYLLLNREPNRLILESEFIRGWNSRKKQELKKLGVPQDDRTIKEILSEFFIDISGMEEPKTLEESKEFYNSVIFKVAKLAQEVKDK